MEQEILQNTYNKKFHNALNKEEQKVPPIWLMRQAGRYHKHYRTLKEKYSFEQLCKEPELACEVTLGPIAEFDFDAAILFSDILFPLDYLGMGLKFKPGPIFERNLNSKMISEFNIDEFENFMEFQSKSLNLIRNELPNDKSLIGFTGGPFTLYHFAIRNNPVSEKLFQQTLPILEELIHKNIQIQFQSDIDLLMIFDTEANNLNDEEFDKLVIPFLKKIADSYPNKIGYFTKGISQSKLNKLQRLENLKLTVLGSNLEIFSELPKTHLSLQGNFSNNLLAMEDSKAFSNIIDEYLEKCMQIDVSHRSGWIASLDHGVKKTTPEANVHLFIEKIRTKLSQKS